MIRTIAWLGQVLLWVRLGWPFAVSVWNILRDGQLTYEEALAAVDLAWPRDENYEPVIIAIPFMKKLRTEKSKPIAPVSDNRNGADRKLLDETADESGRRTWMSTDR